MDAGSQGKTRSREYLSRHRTNISSSESEDSDYPHSSDSSFVSSTIHGDDADSDTSPPVMKGLPVSPGQTLSLAIPLDKFKGVSPQCIINALNTPQVQEEFRLFLSRIANQIWLDTPFPVDSSDWIMESIKPVSKSFHLNSWSSTSEIFENVWDPNAPRDPQGNYKAMSSWRIVHPLSQPRNYEQDSSEHSYISKKATKNPNSFLLLWTTALTTIVALVRIGFLIHQFLSPLDTTPASPQFVPSPLVEFGCSLWGFLISSFFRPLFLRFFLVLVNF